MKTVKYLASILTTLLLIPACNNFEDINTNPDSPTRVNSALLATGAIYSIVSAEGTGKTFVSPLYITKYMGWGENAISGQYNDMGRTSFSNYTTLLDIQTMANIAPEGYEDSYGGLALLLKSYILFEHTMEVGDIPYSEILKGEEGIQKPVYDTQKDVCLHILDDLDEAYAKLANAQDFSGDFIFGGSATQWAKIATALELRVLMHLSKKVDDPDLQVIQRFKKVYERGALMISNDDNLQLTFSDKAGQLYPYHSSYNRHWAYAMLSDFLVNLLKDNEDYRLFYFGKPASTQLNAGVNPDDWNAFVGVDPTAEIAIVKEKYANGECSGLNARYIDYEPGEPYIRLGYAEQKFILAEAALRNWINADPEELYKDGIRASMEFISSHTPNENIYHQGRAITESYIEDFLNQESLSLTGDFDAKLKKIMEQKYIAAFMQLPYQPYYDYRRTSYPLLPINPSTSQNYNAPDKLPMRWQYPDTEIRYNKENVEAAIERQYGGSDEVNKLMWILQ